MSNLGKFWSGCFNLWAVKCGSIFYKLVGFVHFTPCFSSNIHMLLEPGPLVQSERNTLCGQQAVAIFLEAPPHTRMAIANWTICEVTANHWLHSTMPRLNVSPTHCPLSPISILPAGTSTPLGAKESLTERKLEWKQTMVSTNDG